MKEGGEIGSDGGKWGVIEDGKFKSDSLRELDTVANFGMIEAGVKNGSGLLENFRHTA